MRILISVLALGGALLPVTPASAAPQPGTCWNLPASAQLQTTLPNLASVDCDSPHTAELLGVVKGTALKLPKAFQQCQLVAVGYVGGAPVGGPPPESFSLPRTAQLSVYLSGNRKRAYCVGFNTNAKGRVTVRSASVAGEGLDPKVCFNYGTWARQKCSAAKNVDMPNVVWLSTSNRQSYPGYASLMATAETACTDFARSMKMLGEAWFVPDATQWAVGNRYAFCKPASPETDSGWQSIG